MAVTISLREECSNRSSIHYLHKSQRSYSLMALFTSASKGTEVVKAQERPPISMVVFTMESGRMTRSMAWGNFNTSTRPNTTEIGKTMSARATEPTPTQTEIATKANGTATCKTAWGLTTTQTETSTRDNG